MLLIIPCAYKYNEVDRNDFSYQIFILLNSSFRTLDFIGHKWIHDLQAIKPFGINSIDPFGVPLLDT